MKNGHRNGTRRGILNYTYYNFRTQDPIVDQMRTLAGRRKYSHIAADCGLSSTTLSNWFGGKTRCPRYASVANFVGSFGYRLAFVPAEIRASESRPAKAARPIIMKANPTNAQIASRREVERRAAEVELTQAQG